MCYANKIVPQTMPGRAYEKIEFASWFVQSVNNLAKTENACNVGITLIFIFYNHIEFLYTFRSCFELINRVKEAKK